MLAGNSSYSGGTNIGQGDIEITSANALGSGAVNIAQGAQLALDLAGATVQNPITLNGTTTLNGLTGALVGENSTTAGNNTLNSTLTLLGTWNNVTTASTPRAPAA